jgi:hypothetical protein
VIIIDANKDDDNKKFMPMDVVASRIVRNNNNNDSGINDPTSIRIVTTDDTGRHGKDS